MINKNEIRRGNWVLVPEFQSEFMSSRAAIIRSFSDRMAHWEAKSTVGGKKISGSLFEDLSPIPLTIGIIEKCGFYHETLEGNAFKVESVFVSSDSIQIYRFTDGTYAYEHGKNKLQYLHQLQNLFYSLTGEELTINL